MNNSVAGSIGTALTDPDTWQALLGILTALGGIYHGWRKGAAVVDTRKRVVRAAHGAADLVVALVLHDVIPPDGARVVLEWEKRFDQLAAMAGVEVDAKSRADARSIVMSRLGRAAIEHGLAKLAVAASAVSSEFNGLRK